MPKISLYKQNSVKNKFCFFRETRTLKFDYNLSEMSQKRKKIVKTIYKPHKKAK